VPLARVRPAAVGQALQVLLDNALIHGRGDVTVWLEPVRRRDRVWVRLCVGDEGPGVQPQHLHGGDGRGLPLARSLVEAEGGALVVDADHGNRVCLLLPAVDDHRG
jgi:signal transduction histidine kinase